MKTNKPRVARSKHILRIMLATAAVLSVPLIAMQFSDEVAWKFSDFVIIGSLLISTGFLYEFTASKTRSRKQKAIIGTVLLVAMLLIWMELAVGIFGTPFSGS